MDTANLLERADSSLGLAYQFEGAVYTLDSYHWQWQPLPSGEQTQKLRLHVSRMPGPAPEPVRPTTVPLHVGDLASPAKQKALESKFVDASAFFESAELIRP